MNLRMPGVMGKSVFCCCMLVVSSATISGSHAAAPSGARVMVESCEIAFSPGVAPLNSIKRTLFEAEQRIDLAMFRIEHRGLVDTLCFMAREKEIPVRVLVCATVLRDEGYQRYIPLIHKLARNGVEVYEHTRAGKMHLRCVVVDKQKVITGSTNWTPSTFSRRVDDVVILQSPALARIYLQQLDNLFQQARPWTLPEEEKERRPDLLAPPTLQPERDGSMPVAFVVEIPFEARVFFSPTHSGIALMASQIAGARRNVGLSMRWMSHPRIADALQTAAARDVETNLILRRDTVERRPGMYQSVQDEGATVTVQPRKQAKLHLKTAVIDDRWVWTGSANGTVWAEQKDFEDMLLIESPEVAWVYLEAMDALQSSTNPLDDELPEIRERARRRETR